MIDDLAEIVNPDYTYEELEQIAKKFLEARGYKVEKV